MKIFNTVLVFSLALSLVACGGSGGDGIISKPIYPVMPPIQQPEPLKPEKPPVDTTQPPQQPQPQQQPKTPPPMVPSVDQQIPYGVWLTDMNLSGVHHWTVSDTSFNPALIIDTPITGLPTDRVTWTGASKGIIEGTDTRITGTMRAEFYLNGEWSTLNPFPEEPTYHSGPAMAFYVDGLHNSEGRKLEHKKWEFGYVIDNRWQVVGGVGVSMDGSFASSKYGENVAGRITGANHQGIAGTADFNTAYEGTNEKFRVNMIFSGSSR